MAAKTSHARRSSTSAPISGSPTSGERAREIGDYALVRKLGSGAMGEVWLARHRRTGGLSAVKLLHPAIAAGDRVQRFFARERRAIARLSHPHIVALHGLGPGFIATAYVDGADLARRMETPIEPRVAVRYALQIASALSHAHAHGVVHRDVKPSNILVDHVGNAYLADFGLAAIVDDDDETSQDRAGTPAFMAPEQAAGRAGPAADQYGLARTLVEVLAGVSLRDGGDALAHLPPSLPGALVDVLRRATQRDPSKRFADADAFAAALAAVDLGDAGAPMHLAPEQRVRAPFKWCVGAYGVRTITPEIRCADYRMSDLEGAGLLAREQCDAFRDASGYDEMAWTVYAHEGRLGPVASDGALARASDLVVILHGLLCTRKDWHEVAMSICRDNAQAVVLVPDLFGAGESRYVDEARAQPKVTLGGMMDGVLRWLELLSVRDLPTVIVGHSLSGASVLAATDEALGERVSRVAITPAVYGTAMPGMTALAKLTRAMIGWPAARKPIGALLAISPDLMRLAPVARRRLHEEFIRTPSWLMIQFIDEFMTARPARPDSLRRCAILIGDDDAMHPADRIERELIAHGIPRELLQRISGNGHFPSLENLPHPESRARNVQDITRAVQAMLLSSREGAPMSTMMASTVLGEDSATKSA